MSRDQRLPKRPQYSLCNHQSRALAAEMRVSQARHGGRQGLDYQDFLMSDRGVSPFSGYPGVIVRDYCRSLLQ
ncbi:hypothetical protein J6590_037340 [Homalodisca vitripennis]|nr:hypothetical protein J6590_037340 [Homalodisca vitripennis]